jgi:hypothetical protein
MTPDFLISPFPRISPADIPAATNAWCRVLSGLPMGVHEVNFHPGANQAERQLIVSEAFRRLTETNVRLAGMGTLRVRH